MEAKILNKPIIFTDFNREKEQIVNGVTGIIVKSSENDIYIAVKSILEYRELSLKFFGDFKDEKLDTIMEIKNRFTLKLKE